MGAKSAEQFFYEFRDGSAADAAMSLLRSRLALLNLALMAAHLGEGQIVDGTTLTASREVIERNVGRLVAVLDGHCHYYIQ